jgi:hypothetical protein
LENVTALLDEEEFQLTQAVPEKLRKEVPGIEEIEEELKIRLHNNDSPKID